MRFKDDFIGFQNLSPQLLLGLIVVDQVLIMNGKLDGAIITSINDGYHARTSLHYGGNAVDIRSKNLVHKSLMLELFKAALGDSSDFDIILEGKGTDDEHFHLEYQPKRRLP